LTTFQQQVERGKTLFKTIERESVSANVTMNGSRRRIAVKKNRKKNGSHLRSMSKTRARSMRGRVGAQDIIIGMMIMMDIVTALPRITVEENTRGRRRRIRERK
jgi:hypothetical protein